MTQHNKSGADNVLGICQHSNVLHVKSLDCKNWNELPAPVADAGVKRPALKQYHFGLRTANYYDASTATPYMGSLELQLKTAQEEIANYKAGAADSKDWEEMFYADIGAPICETCNERCAPHSLAWAVLEFKRLQDVELQLTQAHGKNVELAERVKELEDALRWALGENGDFRTRLFFEGSYYWRNELRARAALSSAASGKDGE